MDCSICSSMPFILRPPRNTICGACYEGAKTIIAFTNKLDIDKVPADKSSFSTVPPNSAKVIIFFFFFFLFFCWMILILLIGQKYNIPDYIYIYIYIQQLMMLKLFWLYEEDEVLNCLFHAFFFLSVTVGLIN